MILPIQITEITLSPQRVYFKKDKTEWVFDAEKNSCRVIENKKAALVAADNLYSPNGLKSVFVQDNNLWIQDLNSGERCALTHDGTADYPYAAVATPAWISKHWRSTSGLVS